MQFSLSHIFSCFPLAWRTRLSSLAFGSWHGDTVGDRSAQGLAARASVTLGNNGQNKISPFLLLESIKKVIQAQYKFKRQ